MSEQEARKKILYFLSEYQQKREPIRINFRELVPELNNSDRYSHQIHSYPAKLLSNIPYFFLKSDYFCPKNGIILDPFCGTGTVLLEANLSGRSAKGADSNPLAILVSQVKTTYISKDKLQKTIEIILNRVKNIKIDKNFINNEEEIERIERWFSTSTICQLKALSNVIDDIKPIVQRRFFQLCFSNLIKKVSYADPNISVPVILNPDRFSKNPERKRNAECKLSTLKDIDVYDKFNRICQLNIKRIESLHDIYNVNIKTEIISTDARKLTKSLNSSKLLSNNSIDLILTSPPYAGAQKYIRSSWLNLYWLGIQKSDLLRKLNNKNIGRENYLKSEYSQLITTGISAADIVLERLYSKGKIERAYIVGNYINEMKIALEECIRVLKKGGYMIIIIGNNTVCSLPFDTQDYLTSYLISKGMKLQLKLIDDIKSYGLMTKRNKTASTISCEWVLIFQKL